MPTVEMVRRIAPDILVLNEVIYELHQQKVQDALFKIGFKTIAWGVSTHYPGTSISTLLATREPGDPIPCSIPQRPSMGGGAGMAGIRLANHPISVFGMHLTFGSGSLFSRQIKYVTEVAGQERANCNGLILAGDWNRNQAAIFGNPDFEKLGLVSASPVESATCPIFLPRWLQRPLDHIFVSLEWRRVSSQTIAFGSDHLALMVEVGSQNIA